NIDFLGDTWNARWSVIFANVWRGVPFVAITLLAGLQTVPSSLYEAATIDGATPWQMFRYVTYPLLTPIIAVVMTFSVLFTFTDFPPPRGAPRGGPRHPPPCGGALGPPARLGGRLSGRGPAHRHRHDSVPARRHPDLVVRTAAEKVAARREQ